MVRCEWFLILGSKIWEFGCYILCSFYIFKFLKRLKKQKGRPTHPFLKILYIYFGVKSNHKGAAKQDFISPLPP